MTQIKEKRASFQRANESGTFLPVRMIKKTPESKYTQRRKDKNTDKTWKWQMPYLFTRLRKFTGQIELLTFFFFIQETLLVYLIFIIYIDNNPQRYEIKEYTPWSKVAHKIIRLEVGIYMAQVWKQKREPLTQEKKRKIISQ